MSRTLSMPVGFAFLARHELRLAWRDLMGMLTAGRRAREIWVTGFLVAAAVLLHLVASVLVGRDNSGASGPERWPLITAFLVLPFSLMVSQAMESVTRAFYSRSDLDLILSSPAPARRLLAVRVGAIALSTSGLSLLLGAPFINVLAFVEGPGWLAAYVVLLALGVVATVMALSLTILLFRLIGARRTRLIAQIVAALVGATFIVGIQLAAISSIGTLSRIRFLTSELVKGYLPGPESVLWYPARAMSGEAWPLAAVTLLAIVVFSAAILTHAGGFGEKVAAAAGVAHGTRRRRFAPAIAVAGSARAALRRKEWQLLARDHWLVSQTLMQVFYLVPPAFLLWRGFGGEGAIPAVIVPVLVMAAGQLAGGLAWLAISGEDAPQLVATAPVPASNVIAAKVEAVVGAVAFVVAPILVFMAWLDPWNAFVCACGIAAAALSATAIQLWFRTQARRSNFRRRQTSSRVATFAEAFSSIFWAGAAGLWAHGSAMALALAAAALGVLVLARMLRGPSDTEFA